METPHKSAERHFAERERVFARGALSMSMSLVLLLSASLATAQAVPRQSGMASADSGHMATVQGTVFDSVAHEPLAGAQVQFADAATRAKLYAAVTDSLGHYHIDSIPAGQYIAGFFHPSVDLLGIESPLRLVAVAAGSANVVNLGIPGASRMMASLCGPRNKKDSTGAMAGVVRGADSGLPLEGAHVAVSWLEVFVDHERLVSQPRQLIATTDAEGGYRVCGLPGADTMFVNARAASTTSGMVSVGVPARGIARQDFALGDSTTVVSLVTDPTASAEVRAETTVLRGSAKLAGVVVGPNEQPLAEAQIVVRGTGLEAKSDSSGHFVISGLPAGTFSVDARAIGKEPVVIPIPLSSTRPTNMEIRLIKPIQNLTRVLVFGRTPKMRQDIMDFEQRRTSGAGHYFTQDDAILKHAVEITNVLSMVPSVRVMSSGRFGHVLTMHQGCLATVYLDGHKMNTAFEDINDIPPNQLAGIEVYSGALEAPAQYPSRSGCGVVLLWLKH
ncbi:MAG: carboxypeptidase regulatory-like domain-containing protein [Gemmatimonadaceae bacterium]